MSSPTPREMQRRQREAAAALPPLSPEDAFAIVYGPKSQDEDDRITAEIYERAKRIREARPDDE